MKLAVAEQKQETDREAAADADAPARHGCHNASGEIVLAAIICGHCLLRPPPFVDHSHLLDMNITMIG